MGEYSIDLGERGKYDKRNRLNSLTGREWLSLSTTVWNSDSDAYGHLSSGDTERLVGLFSKDNSRVLQIPGEPTSEGFEIRHDTADVQNADMDVPGKFDYVLIEVPKNLEDFPTLGSMSSLDSFATFTNAVVRSGKYVTVVLNKKRYLDNPEIQLDMIESFEKGGFVNKGKVSLVFGSGVLLPYKGQLNVLNTHIYMVHFKKKENAELSDKEIAKCSRFLQRSGKDDEAFGVVERATDHVTSVWKSSTKVDTIGKVHPAPFSYSDIEELLNHFTRPRDKVIDPFVGVASTLLACGRTGRQGVGIDLNEEYIDLGRNRLSEFLFERDDLKLIHGDSMIEVPKLKGPFDYCVTSPPYHNILRHDGQGVRNDKSQFRQGIEYYTEKHNDVGNQDTFDDYISLFGSIMDRVVDKLRDGSFCSIVVSDFTVEKKEKNVTAEIIRQLTSKTCEYKGTILLNQDQKSIYPFGYPYDFVLNHTNQYVLMFRKVK